VGVRLVVTDHAGDEELVGAAGSLGGFSLDGPGATPLEPASFCDCSGRSRSDEVA
jgi:hypothetical protein